jgi:thiosulfate reductase cytochrome b subunit
MKTKSGLSVPVAEVIDGQTRRRQAREHPWLVRLAHWLNAFTLVVMIASGLEIFAAFPAFGDKAPGVDLVEVPASVRLGGWLGGGLQWHLTFMWLFLATGIVYGAHLIASGRWRQVVLLPRDVPGLWPMARHYFLFGPRPAPTEPYNPLQKLAYTATLALGAAAAVTGWLLWKPVQLAPLVELCGGFGMVRLWHFLTMCGLVAFIPGHLVMVALHGWNNFRSMLTGWKADPEYL